MLHKLENYDLRSALSVSSSPCFSTYRSFPVRDWAKKREQMDTPCSICFCTTLLANLSPPALPCPPFSDASVKWRRKEEEMGFFRKSN